MNTSWDAWKQRSAVAILAWLAGVAFVGTGWAQEPPDTNKPQPSSLSIIDLNRALSAYHSGENVEARVILERLNEREPGNVTCLYYLGLIHLEDGLDASRQKNHVRARQEFAEAGTFFKSVLADPELRPIEAALDLGIAKLGVDDPAADKEAKAKNLEYARQAKDTLTQYTSEAPGIDHRLGHFFLGIAYYRLNDLDAAGAGHLDKAERSFQRSLELAEQDRSRADRPLSEQEHKKFQARVTYYFGLIEVLKRKNRSARDRLLEVMALDPNAELSATAEQLVGDIDQAMATHRQPLSLESPLGTLFVEGGVGVGQQYDSNVILLGQDTRLPRRLGQKDDYRVGVQATFDVYRIIDKEEGLLLGESLSIGIGGDTFHLWQPSIGEFDINTYRARAYINWELYKDLFLGLQYDYSYTQLGHKPFISSNRLTPVLSYLWRDGGSESQEPQVRARTDLYYSYEYRDYFDEISRPAFDRDGAYHAVGITQSFNLWKARDIWRDYYSAEGLPVGDAERWLVARIGYLYRNERTQGDEFDLFGNTVFGGVEIPLPYRLTFDFLGEFTWDNYTQPSVLDFRRNERSDFIQRYVFGLTRILYAPGEVKTMPTLEIKTRAGIQLTFQDSNVWDRLSQDVFSYNRAVFSLELAIRF